MGKIICGVEVPAGADGAEGFYLEVEGVPICRSQLVRAAELAALDIGGGFAPQCGHETSVDAMLEAVLIRRVIGRGAPIAICTGRCPAYREECARDAAQEN